MTAIAKPHRGILVGTHFFRNPPEPPERQDWEGGGSGGNRWFFGLLGAVLVVSVLGRFLGPVGMFVVWGLVLLGFVIVRWNDRKR